MPKKLVEFPLLAAQWFHEKNPQNLSEVTAWCEDVVWWKCNQGVDHIWQAQVRGRASRKSSCPFCAKKRVSVTNSLETLCPELLKEWADCEISPSEVMPGSTIKVLWRCANNHTWKALVANRALKKSGCPYCSGHLVESSDSIATTHPELIIDWDALKNHPLLPSHVSAGSGKSVRWKCHTCTHEWIATPHRRALRQQGCPKCNHPNRGFRTLYGRHLEQKIATNKRGAARRGYEWKLDDKQARTLMIADCHYCGSACDPYIKANGLDRKDSSQGYTLDNVVTCCKACNIAKHTMSVQEFYDWLDRLARHQGYTR